MASPIVCVLKPKDKEGHQGVRIAIDYRYVNRFATPSVTPLEDVSELQQQVGQYKILSLFDVKSGYYHCKVANRTVAHEFLYVMMGNSNELILHLECVYRAQRLFAR